MFRQDRKTDGHIDAHTLCFIYTEALNRMENYFPVSLSYTQDRKSRKTLLTKQ